MHIKTNIIISTTILTYNNISNNNNNNKTKFILIIIIVINIIIIKLLIKNIIRFQVINKKIKINPLYKIIIAIVIITISKTS